MLTLTLCLIILRIYYTVYDCTHITFNALVLEFSEKLTFYIPKKYKAFKSNVYYLFLFTQIVSIALILDYFKVLKTIFLGIINILYNTQVFINKIGIINIPYLTMDKYQIVSELNVNNSLFLPITFVCYILVLLAFVFIIWLVWRIILVNIIIPIRDDFTTDLTGLDTNDFSKFKEYQNVISNVLDILNNLDTKSNELSNYIEILNIVSTNMDETLFKKNKNDFYFYSKYVINEDTSDIVVNNLLKYKSRLFSEFNATDMLATINLEKTKSNKLRESLEKSLGIEQKKSEFLFVDYLNTIDIILFKDISVHGKVLITKQDSLEYIEDINNVIKGGAV